MIAAIYARKSTDRRVPPSHTITGLCVLLFCASALAVCAVFRGYAIGREYAIVPIQWPAATVVPCDRLWAVEDTLICAFDGAGPTPIAAPDGLRPTFGVLPVRTGPIKVIRENGTIAPTDAVIRRVPAAVLQQCPPPERRVFGSQPSWLSRNSGLTVGEAAVLTKWQECLAERL